MEDPLEDRMAADLAEIGQMRMPFGKFGPERFPPSGVPRGKLGKYLRIVHQMKVDGSDSAFDPLRKAAGGKRSLRPERRREFRV